MDRWDAARLLSESDGFAESFLRLLGAEDVVSVDASDYEGASRILDLNEPVPADAEGAFMAVVDAGSLEHVFDFRRPCGTACAWWPANGHFLSVTVANNMAVTRPRSEVACSFARSVRLSVHRRLPRRHRTRLRHGAPAERLRLGVERAGPGAGRAARSGLRPVERYVPDAVARALKSLSHLAQATVLPFDRRSFRRVDISNLKPRKRA